MTSILITPKNKSELVFLSNLLEKLKINSSYLSEEDKEDIGLRLLMKQADRKKTVSRSTILKKLNTK